MVQEERIREVQEILEAKKKKGAPFGNQNARTHGFYSKALTRDERRSLRKAINVDGIDGEIALLRVKIKSVVENDPDNVALIAQAIVSLARMVMNRTSLGKQEKEGGLKQVVVDILKDLALPVGIGIGRSLGK